MGDWVAEQMEAYRQLEKNNQASNGAGAYFACREEEWNELRNIFSEIPVEAQDAFMDIYVKFRCLSDSDLSAVETALEEYFAVMVTLLEAAEKLQSPFRDAADYSRAVEKLYLLYCVRDKNTNTYTVPEIHPIRVLNKQLDNIFKELLEERTGQLDYEMLKGIFDAKKRNRDQIRLYCSNQVYEAKHPQNREQMYGSLDEKQEGDIIAYPFRQRPGNTEIPYFRIWEKLSGYASRCKDKLTDNTIRVAVFGKLEGKWESVSDLLESNVKVDWITFENFPPMGEYYFQDTYDGQFYDLSNIMDAKELVHNFNIILFLDLNCLYRQWQTEKTVEERNEGIHCRWYLDRCKEQKEFKDKAAYYQSIYNHVGLWLNSLHKSNSSYFEFDANLFRNLMAAAEESTDIYLYIKESNKIASYNLEYSGVCNDEYYDGKTLLVYKLAQTNEEIFNLNYRKFLEQSKVGTEDTRVAIRFWKLLKSINNNYCYVVMNGMSENKGITCSNLINVLNNSFLILEYNVNCEEKLINIGYDIGYDGSIVDKLDNELRSFMEGLAETVLGYALETQNMHCIKKYFKELLIHSVITNARSIRDLVFSHIWSQPWMKTNFKRVNLDGMPKGDNSIVGKHKLNKTIYVMIERLEKMRMRTVPDIRGYFINVFRSIVCPEVNEANFEETFHFIAECCEMFNHTSSSLFLNSTLIDCQERKNRE